MNRKPKVKSRVSATKRYPSIDISFDSLFTELDRRITSTPCITSSHSSLFTLNSDAMLKMSRSPTPESPPYEELSLIKEQKNAEHDNNNKIQNYLMSMSASPSSAAVAAALASASEKQHQQSDDEGCSPAEVQIKLESINKMSPTTSTTSTTQSHAEQLNTFENDEDFLEFYRCTKESILSENTHTSESLLKKFALKLWMLKHLKQTKINKPISKKRKLKVDDEIDSKNSFLSAADVTRKSIRPSRPPMKRQKIMDPLPIVQPAIDAKTKQELAAEKEKLRIKRAKEKEKREAKEMSRYFMKEFPKNHLFRGLIRQFVCQICLRPGNVMKCGVSSCHQYVHSACAKDPTAAAALLSNGKNQKKKLKLSTAAPIHVTGEDVISHETSIVEDQSTGVADENTALSSDLNIQCLDCQKNSTPTCFVCKSSAEQQLKCTEKLCGRHYHPACLKYWPQNKLLCGSERTQTLLCPSHVCHTCISDDPRGKHYQIENRKLIRCVLCPATYHIDSCCIPAGSDILTANQLVCPRHRQEDRRPINANWCFICTHGGQLICCETCPTAFHADCLKLQPPEQYICEECETGRLPLYGEMVWAKIGSCRWWPSVILPPSEIPVTISAAKHKKHDFCVRFFGTNDYSWISRGFVFLYQEDDSECNHIGDSSKDKVYQKALVKAKEWFEKIKEVNARHLNPEKDKLLKPLPYTKIKSNRAIAPVRLNDPANETEHTCNCVPTDPDPCGPSSGCINRMLYYECNPTLCGAAALCQNQRFEKRLYPNLLEQRIENKGWGLTTQTDIKAGDFIIEYVGELINMKEFSRRLEQKEISKDEHYYFFTVTSELMIDAGPKGNSARFINHSCEPNCEPQRWQVMGNTRVGLFAIEDIPAVSLFP